MTDPENIKEIERVIEANNELKRRRVKRKSEIVISSVHSKRHQRNSKDFSQESRLLSALAGHRVGNININRLSQMSQMFQNNNRN